MWNLSRSGSGTDVKMKKQKRMIRQFLCRFGCDGFSVDRQDAKATNELEDNCPQWDEAYDVFKQLVAQGREKDPQYAAEILKMDDATDFAYGVADWIEDYLDELDAREEHEKLMERCEELLNLFQWQEVYPGDLKFRIASALAAEDKKEEALKFCEKWYAEDQHEMAATALVYAKMTLGGRAC